MPQKQQIRIEQRRALRSWAHNQHPRPTQRACIEWFQQQFGHKFSQSTVSESLSSHFDSLDNQATANLIQYDYIIQYHMPINILRRYI